MNQEWLNFLAQQGRQESGLSFANPQSELRTAQNGSLLVPLTDHGLILATGADSIDFLHNLLTNDIEKLAANAACRAGFCTPKGRLLATLLLWHAPKPAADDSPRLMLALAADLHAAILKKLSMYVLRAKVKLTDVGANQVVLGLAGPAVPQALQALGLHDLPTAPMQTSHFSAGSVICLGSERYWLVTEAATAPQIWQTLSGCLQPAGLDAWNWLEIAAGIPRIAAATREEFTPQMVNFELIGGVSFKKGCYPGQEIVARTQYLGKVKRRMYRGHVASLSEPPAVGTVVLDTAAGPTPCGMVVNVAASPQGGFDLLAVLQTASADAGQLQLADAHAADGAGAASPGALLVLAPLPYAVD